MRQINKTALFQLKALGGCITPQEYKTIKGQILAGDDKGALKGLKKILRRSKRNEIHIRTGNKTQRRRNAT